MTSRITCVYREQWYVIITFDVCTHKFVHSSKTSFINYLPSNSVTLG